MAQYSGVTDSMNHSGPNHPGGAMELSDDLVEQTIRFHGHSCPGLAIGIRAAELALQDIGRADDEDILAVVETDMCGVDAIQFLTGCTFGKGNLIHLDYAKNAFTFYRRRDGKAIRLVTRSEVMGLRDDTVVALREKEVAGESLSPEEQERLQQAVDARTHYVMDAALEEIFDVQPLSTPAPKPARIMNSVSCEACGEDVMESRTRQFMGQTLCIPCFNLREQRW